MDTGIVMKEYIKFSIIVPVYNVELYLAECVNSLLEQTYQNFEIVLVDDGSKDKSGILCDEFSQGDYRVVTLHKENGGLSDARNYGIAHATGEYICFVDSDDYVSVNMLEGYFRNIDQYGKSDVILEPGQYTVFDDKISEVKKYEGGEVFGIKSGKEAFHIILEKTVWAAFGKCFRREFLEQINFSFRKGITSEDLDVIYKVVYQAKQVGMTEQYYYYYRFNRQGSIMSTFGYKNIVDMFDIFERWEAFFDEYQVDNRDRDKMRFYFGENYRGNILPTIAHLNRNEKFELYDKSKKYLNYLLYSKKSLYYMEKIFGIRITCRYCWERQKIIQKMMDYVK